MCKNHSVFHDHLFLLCGGACFLWHNLFGVSEEDWISPASIASFLQMKFRGFGHEVDRNILWQCGIFAILRCIWTERNSRIFRGQNQLPLF